MLFDHLNLKSQKIISVALLFCCSLVNAATMSLSLPALNGSYTGTFGGPGTGKTETADFETEFISIEEAHIHLIGTYTAGTGHNYNGQSGNVSGQLTASMPSWVVMSGILHPAQTNFDFNLIFNPFLNPGEDWSVLLDGVEDITLKLIMHNTYDIIDQNPTANITFAEVILEGSPVPEPSTLLFLIAGTMILRKTAAGKIQR